MAMKAFTSSPHPSHVTLPSVELPEQQHQRRPVAHRKPLPRHTANPSEPPQPRSSHHYEHNSFITIIIISVTAFCSNHFYKPAA